MTAKKLYRFIVLFPAMLTVCFILFSSKVQASEKNFSFELKFGPYKPSIDDEKSLIAKPFEKIFGNETSAMTQIEFDVAILKKFGVLAIGGNIGFYQALGKGLKSSDMTPSADTTVFNVMPLVASLIYRLDYFSEKYPIPFVPYAKFGIAHYLFWITDGKGDYSDHSQGSTSAQGHGGVYGYQYSVGLQFLLDILDEKTAANFDMEYGINNSYIFIEYTSANIDDFGDPGMNLSDDTYHGGLLLEF